MARCSFSLRPIPTLRPMCICCRSSAVITQSRCFMSAFTRAAQFSREPDHESRRRRCRLARLPPPLVCRQGRYEAEHMSVVPRSRIPHVLDDRPRTGRTQGRTCEVARVPLANIAKWPSTGSRSWTGGLECVVLPVSQLSRGSLSQFAYTIGIRSSAACESPLPQA
jgi:hypothetical protein